MKKTTLSLIAIVFSINFSYAQTFNPTYSINSAGTANTLTGGYTFAYATSGSPWTGAFMSFGGFNNTYDCQISTDYGPNGGNHLSFRTRNGDAGTWNSWYEVWHSGNLNNSGTDFTARNIYATGSVNLYGTGDVGLAIESSINAPYLTFRKAAVDKWDLVLERNIPAYGMSANDLGFLKAGAALPSLMIQQSSGYVGIGTSSPDQKLTVKGNIHSQEVIVNMDFLPDYVFKPAYHLPTLTEVKTYIDQNHHLPEMPSAEQVAKEGLSLGDMNARLLKKVEELTLYILQQNERINKLEESLKPNPSK